MSISLRTAWSASPRAVGTPTAPHFDYRTGLPVVVGSAPTLQPLSRGIRASSQIEPLFNGAHPLPFNSIRQLCESFTWDDNTGYKFEIVIDEVAIPGASEVVQRRDVGSHSELSSTAGTYQEVQGMAHDADAMYLITNDVVWAVAEPDRPLKHLTGIHLLSTEDGIDYRGRRILRDSDLSRGTGPNHMSAPAMYQGKLLIPAEGGPYVPGTIGSVKREDLDPRISEEEAATILGRTYMWVWVFEVRNLTLIGRIAVPSEEPPGRGLRSHITACAADERSGLLYCTRSGEGDDGVGEIQIFRMPDLSSFPVGSDAELEKAGDVSAQVDRELLVPTRVADVVGVLPLVSDQGVSLSLINVNGIAVSPAGHIYVSCTKLFQDHDNAESIVGFDAMTGVAVRLMYLEDRTNFTETVEGIAIVDGKIRVAIYDWDFGDNDYSVWQFTPPIGGVL